MTFTYDVTTDIGKVRLLTRDTDASNRIFTDEEIQAYLTLEGDVKLAAAQVLDDIATDQILLLQVKTSGDYSIDAAAMAVALRARATELRKQVADALAISDGNAFDLAEIVWEELF